MSARALHYVFKIANRAKTYDFYTKVLKMKVLRHEEYGKGCDAGCNGPFDGQWSKTMMGYGNEDEFFVVELTYNYPIHQYKVGNQFRAMVIDNDDLFEHISKIEHRKSGCGRLAVKDPDGYEFKIGKGSSPPDIRRVQVNVNDLQATKKYWNEILGMIVIEEKPTRIIMGYGSNQCQWEIVQSSEKIDRGNALVRIAYSYPDDKLAELQEKVKKSGNKILTELKTLETPGKADVQVVILADPDEHEICFVGDKAFRELSKVDDAADSEIQKQIKADDSEKFY